MYSKGVLDYAEFVPINTTTNSTEINIKMIDDDISMETNESVILRFMPHRNDLCFLGEYVRDTATVNIIDNDGKYLPLQLVLLALRRRGSGNSIVYTIAIEPLSI